MSILTCENEFFWIVCEYTIPRSNDPEDPMKINMYSISTFLPRYYRFSYHLVKYAYRGNHFKKTQQ